MASSIFKPSRILSVLIILAAAGWIASGMLTPEASQEPPPVDKPAEEPKPVAQRVSVSTAIPQQHQRQVTLSCNTKADHSSVAVARGGGVIVDLNVDRGSEVHAGDVVAKLSDEGRQAAVKQTQALLDQRRAEYEANKKLIESGNSPKLQLPSLEAAVAAAEAALSIATSEADRAVIRSPLDGVVTSVPVEVGQAIQPATAIAEIIDPDPMLAIGAVSERERGHLKVGQEATVRFIDGREVRGSVSYVGLSADSATRTYPVETTISNADASIPDGVTCEMVVDAAPIEAASIPRSALVFSDDGELGVRYADDESRVGFMPVSIIDDGRESVWVTGIDRATQVIIVGQDFVKEGDLVEAVSAIAAVEPAR